MEVAWNQVRLVDMLQCADDLQQLYSEVHLLSTLSHDSIIRFYTSWIDSQFVAEIEIISVVQHRDLVKLYGCCIEGEKRLLVYEHLENKSLDLALFVGKGRLCLDWATRFDTCLGVARGLAYLHEESRLRIIHIDVKATLEVIRGRANADSSQGEDMTYLLELAAGFLEILVRRSDDEPLHKLFMIE
ncbi:hypothetical protein ACS0TY_032645 [Phlomoides rotata]